MGIFAAWKVRRAARQAGQEAAARAFLEQGAAGAPPSGGQEPCLLTPVEFRELYSEADRAGKRLARGGGKADAKRGRQMLGVLAENPELARLDELLTLAGDEGRDNFIRMVESGERPDSISETAVFILYHRIQYLRRSAAAAKVAEGAED